MNINKLLTPYNYTNGNINRIKYIVIHYVGATGGAESNCKYYASQYVGASAHYYVGFNGEIWQSVEDKNIAWHCGTKGKYYHPNCRNSNSIGIELCVRNKGNKADTSKDWYFEDATVNSAIQLTKELMQKYNVPIENVIRHYDVTHKICPNPFVYNHTKHTWDNFKESLIDNNDEHLYTKVSTGKDGLTIKTDSLNIRSTPGTGIVIGLYKLNDHVYPLKKMFVNNEPWYQTDKGWISANYVEGWIQEESGLWWYVHKGYTYTKNDWEQIDGLWYYFDENGYAIKDNWRLINSHWYLFNSDCVMLTGWQLKDGKWYYLESDNNSPYVGALYRTDENGAQSIWEVN